MRLQKLTGGKRREKERKKTKFSEKIPRIQRKKQHPRNLRNKILQQSVN